MIIRERRVMVWNTQLNITVHKKSKTVWIASGEYLGQTIEVKGESEGSAVIRWREAAKYKGG